MFTTHEMQHGDRPTLEQIRRWPATVDIPTAGWAFGVSRSHAYELVARGEFPARVIRLGGRRCVVTASIVRKLSDEETEAPVSGTRSKLVIRTPDPDPATGRSRSPYPRFTDGAGGQDG